MIGLIKNDKRLTSIADMNYARSELLSLVAIRYSIEECKNLWIELCKLESKHADEESFGKVALRLDFTMTFYQFNCLLIDNFHDPDYFARNSKIDVIIDNKPTTLTAAVMPEIEHKLKLL